MKPGWKDSLWERYADLQRFFSKWYGFHPETLAPLHEIMRSSSIKKGPEVPYQLAMLVDDLMLALEPKEKQMKFKVGDRVKLVRPKKRSEYDRLLLKQQEASGFLKVFQARDDETVLIGAPDSRFPDQWYVHAKRLEPNEPERTPTERRLLEALRPFAKWAKLFRDDLPDNRGVQVPIGELRAAVEVLRELGEYPETCKECGQEIRHDTN